MQFSPFAYMGTEESAGLVDTGLSLYLDAGVVSSYPGSGSSWNDIAGVYAQNFTLYNSPSHTSGDTGYFDFNGSSQYAANGTENVYVNTDSGSVEWTIETISEADNIGGSGAYKALATVWHGTGNQIWWHGLSGATTGGIHWALRESGAAGGDSQFYNSSAIYSVNTLTHMVWKISYPNSTLNAWINGTQVITDDALTVDDLRAPIGGGYLDIGRQGAGNHWDGKIAVVRIYNEYGFSSSDVTQNYNYWRNTRGYNI